ncbi:hypothetical protein HK102_006688 [Quaeritorhiza haematococci]|nr:hypothetical protein HK102_006688 [Quaeritorhiza haematococci]
MGILTFVIFTFHEEKEKPDYPAGMKIEHSNDGAMVKEAILWEEERVKQHKTKLVTKLLDDFNELRKPQIARVCDPIKDTLKVTPAHTFGLVLPPDDYDARDLIRQRPLREAKKALKQKRQHQDEQSSEAEPSPPPQQEQPKQFQRGRQVPAEGRRSPRRQGTRNPVEEEIEDEGEVEEGEEALTDKITSLPPGGLLDGSKKRNPAEMPAFGAPTIRIGTRPLMQKLADSKNYGDQFNAKALLAPTARNLYGRERITRMVQHLFESHDGPTTSAPNDPSPLSIREFQAPADDPAALIDRRFRREKLSVKDLLEPFAEKKDELRKTQHEWVFV